MGVLRKLPPFMKESLLYIQEYGLSTTLHGIPHILTPTTHGFEKLTWLFVVVFSTFGAVELIKDSLQRFSSNPTVISRETDFRTWNTPMPANTFCILNQVDRKRAAEFIKRQWNVDEQHSRYKYYFRFIEDVTNIQLDHLDRFSSYENDTSLLNIDMLELALQVVMDINATYSAFNSDFYFIKYRMIISEIGICYSYGGILSEVFYVKKHKALKEHEIPYCNYLNSHCFTRIENLPSTSSVKFFVHSPFEVASLENTASFIHPCEETDSTFKFFQIIASEELHSLKPSQRKCRFTDELPPHTEYPAYSYNICRMECRKKLFFSLCGCAPYTFSRNGSIPICNNAGLSCLAKYASNIIKLRDDKGIRIDCDCLLNCQDLFFNKDKTTVTPWVKPLSCNTRMRWAVEQYNRVRLRREVIYSFEDLLTSLGGTAALFLGCSLVTFAELFYFFTIRLYWFTKKQKASTP